MKFIAPFLLCLFLMSSNVFAIAGGPGKSGVTPCDEWYNEETGEFEEAEYPLDLWINDCHWEVTCDTCNSGHGRCEFYEGPTDESGPKCKKKRIAPNRAVMIR